MSKAILIVVIALAVLALAPLAIGEKGYVLIAFNDYTIEGTITAFVILTLLASAAVYITFRLIRYVLSLYGITRFKWAFKAEQKRLATLQSSVWQFINHDYTGVQKSLEKASVPEGWENIAAALSARSALETNNKESARLYLTKVTPQDTSNIAQMLVASEQAELAKETMDDITKNKKASAQELANFAEYLVAQQDWQQLAAQLTRFEKKHALNDAQWDTVFERYFSALDKAALQNAFANLPKKLKEKAERYYLINLISFEPEQAEKYLVKMLKADRYREVWDVLKNSNQGKLPELHKFVQSKLKKLPDDATLLFTLAYVAKIQGDYELACKVFNKTLSQDNAQQHWRIAAECFVKAQQNDKALMLYQRYA